MFTLIKILKYFIFGKKRKKDKPIMVGTHGFRMPLSVFLLIILIAVTASIFGLSSKSNPDADSGTQSQSDKIPIESPGKKAEPEDILEGSDKEE